MSSEQPNPVPRLFLITPPIASADAFAPLLETALGTVDVACVLLRTAARDEGQAKAILRALVPIVQRHDAAALVDGDSRLAARVDADGVHIDGDEPTLGETLAALKPNRIVGAGGLTSRDAAMVAGEAGVDYLMFGGPAQGDPEAVLEWVSWWAAIFNVPCVGYAHAPRLAGEIARAGAEFVGLCEGLWDEPARIAETLASVATAIQPQGAVA